MTLKDLVATFIDYLNIAIYLIISLAVLTFIWNIYRYFFTEKDKKEAGQYVLFSTIGFFVILSFWGLVAIVSNSLKLPTNRPSWPFSGSTGYSGSTFGGSSQFKSSSPSQSSTPSYNDFEGTTYPGVKP